ncbi:TIP41-like family-domain-containing protein [Xylariaceae sp. FL0804]|nr:TIP41-like family-domain-containing protein [Xylariaceae sp. FL0804]
MARLVAPGPDEPFPTASDLARATSTHRQGAFEITTRRLPISRAGPIAALEAELAIPVPEMIFGDNLVRVRHAPSGWRVDFSARDALNLVDKTGEAGLLQVKHAREWSSTRRVAGGGGGTQQQQQGQQGQQQGQLGVSDAPDVDRIARPYDWSYSTTYRGTVAVGGGGLGSDDDDESSADGQNNQEKKKNGVGVVVQDGGPPPPPQENGDGGGATGDANATSSSSSRLAFRPSPDRPIPIELLKRRDPILFFDEVTLYESELDDNGVSALSVKVRVHARRMLLLSRLYMRLDGVLVRVRDTRVYVDFAAHAVTREYTARELAFDEVRQKLLMTGLRPDGVTVALRDANQVVDLLPTVEHSLESVDLPQ